MVRTLVSKTHTADLRYVQMAGISTDDKPTDGIITGSTFLEVDTGTMYAFDEVSGSWHGFYPASPAPAADDNPPAVEDPAQDAPAGDENDG